VRGDEQGAGHPPRHSTKWWDQWWEGMKKARHRSEGLFRLSSGGAGEEIRTLDVNLGKVQGDTRRAPKTAESGGSPMGLVTHSPEIRDGHAEKICRKSERPEAESGSSREAAVPVELALAGALTRASEAGEGSTVLALAAQFRGAASFHGLRAHHARRA